ncbi:MAG TPA: hypothetical protein VKX40_08375 [Aequorivita sp.]|nr:hypothetical protein [Aequorivita sp.]
MGQKTEIGNIFAAKLKDGKKSPSKDAWNRLDTFLEEKQSKKRKTIAYWLIGGGILFLMASYILFGTNIPTSDSPSSQEKSPQKGAVEFVFDHDRDKKDTSVKTNDSIKNILKNDNQSSQQSGLEEITEGRVQNNQQKPTTMGNPKIIEETFEVTENYYYYNSRDGKKLVTKRKEVIDSLLNKGVTKPDSIP